MQRDVGAAPRQRLRGAEDRRDADAAGDQAIFSRAQSTASSEAGAVMSSRAPGAAPHVARAAARIIGAAHRDAKAARRGFADQRIGPRLGLPSMVTLTLMWLPTG